MHPIGSPGALLKGAALLFVSESRRRGGGGGRQDREQGFFEIAGEEPRGATSGRAEREGRVEIHRIMSLTAMSDRFVPCDGCFEFDGMHGAQFDGSGGGWSDKLGGEQCRIHWDSARTCVGIRELETDHSLGALLFASAVPECKKKGQKYNAEWNSNTQSNL